MRKLTAPSPAEQLKLTVNPQHGKERARDLVLSRFDCADHRCL